MKEKPGILSARRIALLAGAAGLSATVLVGAANLGPNTTGPALFGAAYAQTVQRPVGFADIVEKVKPAVISVRVKVDAGAKMMGLEEMGRSPRIRPWSVFSGASACRTEPTPMSRGARAIGS